MTEMLQMTSKVIIMTLAHLWKGNADEELRGAYN